MTWIPLPDGKVRVTVALHELSVPCEFLALYVNVYVPGAGTVALNPPSGPIDTLPPPVRGYLSGVVGVAPLTVSG